MRNTVVYPSYVSTTLRLVRNDIEALKGTIHEEILAPFQERCSRLERRIEAIESKKDETRFAGFIQQSKVQSKLTQYLAEAECLLQEVTGLHS